MMNPLPYLLVVISCPSPPLSLSLSLSSSDFLAMPTSAGDFPIKPSHHDFSLPGMLFGPQCNIFDAALVFLPPRLIWIISHTDSGQPVATRRAGSDIVLFGAARWVAFLTFFTFCLNEGLLWCCGSVVAGEGQVDGGVCIPALFPSCKVLGLFCHKRKGWPGWVVVLLHEAGQIMESATAIRWACISSIR